MRFIKGLVAAFIVTFLCGLTWQGYKMFIGLEETVESELARMEAEGAPDFEIKSDTIKNIDNLYKIGTPVTLVHFWASWCGPCIDEFPELLALNKKNKNITIVVVSEDESEKEYRAFLKTINFEENQRLISVLDEDYKIAGLFGTEKLPETYILGKNKQLIRKVPNPEKWDSPIVDQYFEAIVKQEIERPAEDRN
ncbi:MAG: TlpA family protein disulfide reductase [Bdellovibrionales bacterium]